MYCYFRSVTGAAAASGKSLSEVAALARSVCRLTGTLGVSMNNVTVPGATSINDRLDELTIEIGLGIHGEAGLRQSTLLTADELAAEMIDTIQKYGRSKDESSSDIVPFCKPGDQVVVVMNNLGATSYFEMSILARSCISVLESESFGVKASRVLVGAYMTSFDMHGASITLMNVTGRDDLLELLDATTAAPAWYKTDAWKNDSARLSSIEVAEKVVDEARLEAKLPLLEVPEFATLATAKIRAAVQNLADSEPILTKYDTIVGDGDCGITMKRGAVEVLGQLSDGTLPVDHPVSLFSALADAVSKSMGGTSGVLIEILFRKMSSTLARTDSIGRSELCDAFQSGVDAVSFYGGAAVGSRTMLDALVPAAQALITSNSLQTAAEVAQAGAASTATMRHASAGRSNYLGEEQLAGTPDPGAEAVAIVLESLAKP
jgi:dihydroxyacetone kinase